MSPARLNLAVAAGFTVMGAFVIYLAGAGPMTGGPGFQVAIGRGLARLFRPIETWTRPVPQAVLGLALLALAAVFVLAALHGRHQARPGNPAEPVPEQPAAEPAPDDAGHCHPAARKQL